MRLCLFLSILPCGAVLCDPTLLFLCAVGDGCTFLLDFGTTRVCVAVAVRGAEVQQKSAGVQELELVLGPSDFGKQFMIGHRCIFCE